MIDLGYLKNLYSDNILVKETLELIHAQLSKAQEGLMLAYQDNNYEKMYQNFHIIKNQATMLRSSQLKNIAENSEHLVISKNIKDLPESKNVSDLIDQVLAQLEIELETLLQ